MGNYTEPSPEGEQIEPIQEQRPERRIEGMPIGREANVELIIESEIGNRIDIEDFRDVYGDERVDAAHQKVKGIEEYRYDKNERWLEKIEDPAERSMRREEEIKKIRRGEAFESLLRDQIEIKNWFGEDAYVARTSKYDDYVNGVDVVVEFDLGKGNEERVALSVDISMDASSVQEKIERNIKKVLEGDGASVEFFESQLQGRDLKGEIRGIIPVAIGVDSANTTELFERSAQLIRLERSTEETDNPNVKRVLESRMNQLWLEIQNDPIQKAYIREIKAQVAMFALMLKGNPDKQVLREEAVRLNKFFRGILDSKENIRLGELENDATYQNIIKTVKDKIKPTS